jgi:hypothetical protein
LGPHSYDAGVSQTGVTWVTEVPEGTAHADLDEGSALLHAENICVFDAFTVANSLTPSRPLGNLVKGIFNSLRMEWSGVQRRVTGFSDSVDRFRGDFVETSAQIEVTVTTPLSTGHGFRFVSDPGETTVSHFAQIGNEHNGVFF